MIKVFLIALSFLFLSFNCIDKNINEPSYYNHKERFDPSLSFLNSINKLESYTDSMGKAKGIAQQSIQYYVLLKSVISARFYHGFSHYTLKENWIAAVIQKYIGYGVNNKVITADIMKNPMAACSQQAAVMMAIAKNKNVPYRHVGFPHHYAVEVNFNNNWYYFDPNMEPDITLEERLQQNWQGNNDNLKPYYNQQLHPDLNFVFGEHQKAEFGPVNESPARNLKLFQATTKILSKILWMFPLLILVMMKKHKTSFSFFKKRKEMTSAVYPLLPA